MTKISQPKKSKKGLPPAMNSVIDNLNKPQPDQLKPLNFKVNPEFHREFKSFAVANNMSMIDLLVEAFRLIKENKSL